MDIDNKMIILMMLGCLGMAMFFYTIPAGWLGSGIGIALLSVLLFACCIPMIKMRMGTEGDQYSKKLQWFTMTYKSQEI